MKTTPTDQRFLAQLARDGIPPRNPITPGSGIATAAKAISRAFKQADIHSVMAAQYLTPQQATAYIHNVRELVLLPTCVPTKCQVAVLPVRGFSNGTLRSGH